MYKIIDPSRKWVHIEAENIEIFPFIIKPRTKLWVMTSKLILKREIAYRTYLV